MKQNIKKLVMAMWIPVAASLTSCSSVEDAKNAALLGGAGLGGAAIGSAVSSDKAAPIIGAGVGAGAAYLYMSSSERRAAAKRQEYIDLGIATALQRHFLLLNDRLGEPPKSKTYYYTVPTQEVESDGTRRMPQTVTIPIVE